MGKQPNTKIVSRCQGCQWYDLGQEQGTTRILKKIDGMKNTLNAIEEVGIALAKENEQFRKQNDQAREHIKMLRDLVKDINSRILFVSREQAYTAWASKMDTVLEATKPEVEE